MHRLQNKYCESVKSHHVANDGRNSRTKMFSVGQVNSSKVFDRTLGIDIKTKWTERHIEVGMTSIMAQEHILYHFNWCLKKKTLISICQELISIF